MKVQDLEIITFGRFPRIVRLRNEYYDYIPDPAAFVADLKRERPPSDLFTFLQHSISNDVRHAYASELESISVIPITTYDHWWSKQIKGKTRNMIRKSEKLGVAIQMVELNDELVAGITEIFHETPIRQGKPFAHYDKDFDAIKRDHLTYLDRSEFIGAYFEGRLIGYVKLVHGEGVSNIMQILSKVADRDKAPNNGLIAKAVERCAARGVRYLHYGMWSGRGLGSFKTNNAFERLDVRRYYVPLNARGRLSLKWGMHHPLRQRIPPRYADVLIRWRDRWNKLRHGGSGGE